MNTLMNTLRELLDGLVAHGPTLLLGATAVLTIGIGLMLLQRCPARRRATGLCTALACAVYLLAGTLPLPRVSWPSTAPAELAPAATEAAPVKPLDAEARAALLLQVLQQEPLPATATPAGPAAPAPAPAAVPQPLPWALLAAAAYAAGALLVLARGLLGVLRLRLLLARSMPAPAGMLHGIDIPARTRVRLVREAVRPFCAGALRPVIVLPASLALRPARAEAHAVLRHEAAHVRAGDPRLQALLALLAVPLWCHPLFWWVCRRVRFCSELLADDAASRGDRAGYARALLDLAERGQHELVAAGTIAVFRRPSEFYRRIQMLLQREGTLTPPATLRRSTAHLLCTAGLAAAFSMLLGVPAAAQDPKGRDLQTQNQHLRATIEEMRVELRRLRDEIDQLRPTLGPAGQQPALAPPAGASPRADEPRVRDVIHADGFDPKTVFDRQGCATAPAVPGLPGVPDLAGTPDPAGAPTGLPPRGAPPMDPDTAPTLDQLLSPDGAHAGAAPHGAPPADPLLPTLDRTWRDRELDDAKHDEWRKQGAQAEDEKRVRDLLEARTYGAGGDYHVQGYGGEAGSNGQPRASAGTGGLYGAGTQAAAPTPLGSGAAAMTAAPTPLGSQPPRDPSTATNAIAELALRYVDLQADLEVAEPAAAQAKSLAGSGLTPQSDARRAQVHVETLRKKLAMVKRLVEGEIRATETELTWLEKAGEGQLSAAEQADLAAQRARAAMRLEALRSVQ